MKKLFLATAAFVAWAVIPAGAADLRMPVKAPPPVVPICANFAGGYIGGNVGWGYYNYDYHDKGNLAQTIDDNLPVNARLKDDRWNAGAQIGYNWQSRCTVFGIEADWSWTNTRPSDTFLDGDGLGQDSINVESRMRWFGTVRARTGVVVDNVLLYVTGGFAYARFNNTFLYNDPGFSTQLFASSRTRWGYAIGAGTEWSFGGNWSLVSEFMFLGFEKDEQSYGCSTLASCNGNPVGTAYRYENNDNVWVSRIGLNYRFNYAPIAAKY